MVQLAAKLLIFVLICIYSCYGFHMAPKRGAQRVYFAKDSKEEGYGPVGSLIRQGPVPFLIRITNPDTYEAAVQKYMAIEKCDRMTAQGNMDAYFQDPNGWAGNKLRARKTGKDLDYANMNTEPKQLILTAIWAVGISFLFYRIFAVQVSGQQ
jgi:hypothetical protein